MGVGVQGEARRVVTQHPGHRLDVHSVLQGQGGECMPEIMEPDFGQSRPFQHPVEHMQHTVRENRHTRWAGEHPGCTGTT